MNPIELKNCLYRIVEKDGSNSIAQLEYDFMTGKIDFRTYLNRCYADYTNGNFSKKKKS